VPQDFGGGSRRDETRRDVQKLAALDKIYTTYFEKATRFCRTKQWLSKNKKYCNDPPFQDLEDELSKKLPAELSCMVRVLKQRNVADLPDAEVQLSE